MRLRVVLALCTFITTQGAAQSQRVQRVDGPAVERETLEHFQAIVRLDTSNPPGNETRVAEYLSKVLAANSIPVQVFALEPARANVVARLKGNGTRRPLLLMGHTDVVSVLLSGVGGATSAGPRTSFEVSHCTLMSSAKCLSLFCWLIRFSQTKRRPDSHGFAGTVHGAV